MARGAEGTGHDRRAQRAELLDPAGHGIAEHGQVVADIAADHDQLRIEDRGA
jgi:hypothetical protein